MLHAAPAFKLVRDGYGAGGRVFPAVAAVESLRSADSRHIGLLFFERDLEGSEAVSTGKKYITHFSPNIPYPPLILSYFPQASYSSAPKSASALRN